MYAFVQINFLMNDDDVVVDDVDDIDNTILN